jgi:hypothetical protein
MLNLRLCGTFSWIYSEDKHVPLDFSRKLRVGNEDLEILVTQIK